MVEAFRKGEVRLLRLRGIAGCHPPVGLGEIDV